MTYLTLGRGLALGTIGSKVRIVDSNPNSLSRSKITFGRGLALGTIGSKVRIVDSNPNSLSELRTSRRQQSCSNTSC